MVLRFDPKNPRAVEVHAFLQQNLDTGRLDPSYYIVIGGDGFMLEAVREDFQPERTFLGLNCGRLGFLMNDLPGDIAGLPERILSERLRVHTFPRIAMEAVGPDGELVEAVALNDVYLERTTGQGCHLELEINGTGVVSEMVCDGLILCTALGSTAYSFSAGGTPCHPSLNIIGVTPVCPHAPKLPPLIVPLQSSVVVQVLNTGLRPVRAVADGREYIRVSRLEVRDAQSPVRMAFFSDHHFTGTLVAKLLKP